MIDIDHLRAWIGRNELQSELLTSTIVERFNAIFCRVGDSENGAIAPMMIHLCLTVSAVATSALGSDGHPARGGFLSPVPLRRRMWAGGALTFHDHIRVGDTVTRRSTILDVTMKEGRTGRLCFVTIEHKIESNGRAVITERQDIVYRDVGAPGAPEKTISTPPPAGAHRMHIEPSTPLLFRYSALTFNSHRIHYDAAYVREVEGYPGLVVHGPMQATMLAHFAEQIRGRSPQRFQFRSLSPLFDNADYTLNAEEDGAALRLWTAHVGGPVAMEARAEW